MTDPQGQPQSTPSSMKITELENASNRKPAGRRKAWQSVSIPAIALLVGGTIGFGTMYAYTTPIIRKAQEDYANSETLAETLNDQVVDMQGQIESLTSENAELSQTIKNLTSNVNDEAEPVEVVDIQDAGSSGGYRTIEFTVKNNSLSILSNAFVNFSLEDSSGNSVDTGQASSTSFQLKPGAMAVLQAVVTDEDAAGNKVVPASWSSLDQGNGSDHGTYGQGVKTLDLQ